MATPSAGYLSGELPFTFIGRGLHAGDSCLRGSKFANVRYNDHVKAPCWVTL